MPEFQEPDSSGLEQRLLGRIDREKKARKEAERLLEEKSLELYKSNQELKAMANNLELLVSQRTEDLQKALVEAQSATVAKSSFLATMSHEIRTPMNGVLGMAEALLDTSLSNDQESCVHIIKSCSQTLLAIINDVLDFSKIEADKLELERLPVNLRQLLDELLGILKPQALDKGVVMTMLIDPQFPQLLSGDPTRLRQIFFNLLSNALKFTDNGSITVRLKITEIPDLYQAIVSDTGIGIDINNQRKLFSAFTQANNEITRQYGGTGLGLAICAKLTELMGGRIWVESELSKGSHFNFTFKAAEIDHEMFPLQDELTRQSFPHIRLLLVEDNLVNQKVGIRLLQKIGIKPDIANDGLAALKQIELNVYDIVLMDLQMPIMDGLTATQKIREITTIHQPYIVALTANAFKEDKDACHAAGMDAFLSKPLVFQKLYDMIDQFVSRNNNQDHLQE